MTGSNEPGDEIVVEVDEDLKDLIPIFLENRAKDINALRKTLAAGAFETARDLGHGMKGSGGGYGFHTVSEIGRAIEEAGRNRDADALADLIEALADHMARVRVVFVPFEDD